MTSRVLQLRNRSSLEVSSGHPRLNGCLEVERLWALSNPIYRRQSCFQAELVQSRFTEPSYTLSRVFSARLARCFQHVNNPEMYSGSSAVLDIRNFEQFMEQDCLQVKHLQARLVLQESSQYLLERTESRWRQYFCRSQFAAD